MSDDRFRRDDRMPAGPRPSADDETQVGMPVPPAPPPAAPQPPPAQPPAPPAQPPLQPPATGQPPRPTGYRPPPAYGHPSTRDSGPSALLLTVLAIGLLLLFAVGAMFTLGVGPFAAGETPFSGIASPPATAGLTAPPSLPPAGTPPEPPATPLEQTPAAATPTGATPPPLDPTPAPATPVPVTTAPPSPAPTNGAVEELLGHVPPDVRATCVSIAGTDIVAAVTCPVDDGEILATYTLFGDATTMQRAYDALVSASGIDRDSGRCSDDETWPAEGSYSIERQPAGRVLCTFAEDVPIIYWTDDRLNILTAATGTSVDTDELYDFWEREAGPIP